MKLLLLTLFVAAAAAAPLDASGNPVELIVHGVPEGHALELADIVDITVKEHADGEVVAQSNLLHPLTAVGIAEAAVAAAEAIAIPNIPEVNPETPAVVDVNPEMPAVVDVNPETPAVVDVNPEMPAVIDVNPETPAVVDVNPELPAVVDVNPETPAVVDVNPEMPAVADVNPETPAVIDVNPETPAVVDVNPETPAVVDSPVIPVVPVAPVEVVDLEAIPDPAAQVQNPSGEVYNDGMVQVQVNYPEEEGVIGTLKSWISVALNYFQNGVTTTQQII